MSSAGRLSSAFGHSNYRDLGRLYLEEHSVPGVSVRLVDHVVLFGHCGDGLQILAHSTLQGYQQLFLSLNYVVSARSYNVCCWRCMKLRRNLPGVDTCPSTDKPDKTVVFSFFLAMKGTSRQVEFV
jgi:hypothetical protein